MRKITTTLLVALLAGCATQPGGRSVDERTRAESQKLLNDAVYSFRTGKIPKASESVEQAIKLDPTNAQSYALRALTRQRLGQYDSATRDFQKAIDLSPNNPLIRNNFGTLLCDQKEYSAAEQNFLFAGEISNNPEPEIAYTNAGLCARRAGQEVKAKEYFEKAINHNAGQPAALYQLAAISLDRGIPTDASTYLTQYLNHASHTPKTLLLGARVEHAMGNLRGVEDYLTDLQTKYPDAPELRQARQLIDPITRTLAASPSFPSTAYESPPATLSVPTVTTPGVDAVPLATGRIPAPTPLPSGKLPEISAPALAAAAAMAAAEPEPELSSPAVSMPTPTVAPEPRGPATPAAVPVVESPAPVITESPFPPKNGPFPVMEKDWILKQDPGHYALQLLAVDNVQKIDDLIKSDVAPDLLARFNFKRHDKQWYNLVLGHYDKSSKAQAALNALPAELKALSPWIRPYRSLQRVIEENEK